MTKVRELLASWKSGRPNAVMCFAYASEALERAVNEDESAKPVQIVRYAQVEAIHEAIESIERSRHVFDEAGDVIATSHGYGAGAVRDGIAKIRAALAGDTVEESDERMVRPEDVAPAVTERSEEDSKITWQG